MILFIILAAVVFTFVAFLIFIGLRKPHTTDEKVLLERLEELIQRGEYVDLEKIELSQPFTERVVYPVARKLGEIAVRFTPQNVLSVIAKNLELAGSPARLDPTIILASQFITMIFFGGLIFFVLSVGQMNWPTGRIFLVAIFFGIIGFVFPQLWLKSKITRRQKNIRRAMPDALDLLTICVEAGLGFDAAMAKVSEKWDTELSFAFAIILKEIQLGKLRREALRDMASRTGLAEMTSFVAAVIQSEMLGVSLAKVLRIQSNQMRIRRRQIAEEEAHKAPIKMLIPMGLLIFPSLLVILLTPAAIRVFNSSLGSMFR